MQNFYKTVANASIRRSGYDLPRLDYNPSFGFAPLPLPQRPTDLLDLFLPFFVFFVQTHNIYNFIMPIVIISFFLEIISLHGNILPFDTLSCGVFLQQVRYWNGNWYGYGERQDDGVGNDDGRRGKYSFQLLP